MLHIGRLEGNVMKSKFYAKKIKTPQGTFDSKVEYKRYIELSRLQELQDGIRDLDRQIQFELIPKHKAKLDAKTERAVNYTCDFVFIMDDTLYIEDVKSDYTRKEKDYIIRRKLFKWVYLNEQDTEYKKLHEALPHLRFKNAKFNEYIS